MINVLYLLSIAVELICVKIKFRVPIETVTVHKTIIPIDMKII